MNTVNQNTIDQLDKASISDERKSFLQPLINYLENRRESKGAINLNLICTHNSRRSHLSQVWAQTMAHAYNIEDVYCYSGGTAATAVFPKVFETLKNQGFEIQAISDGKNPVYAIKFDDSLPAVIGFSKTYDDAFNAKSDFYIYTYCVNILLFYFICSVH